MKAYCLAILGAGQAAIPIIEKAKQMAVKVIAFARLDSYAKEMVDVFIEENSFDIDFMARKCIEYDVDGVMATSELTTEVAALLACKLNLPGNDVQNGFAGKNKYIMRQRVSSLQSVKQPVFELYRPGQSYDYPVVVKPTDSCGKRGIGIAYSVRDLPGLVENAAKNSSNGEVLIEEYLPGGKEYSIECLSFAGSHQVIQYTEKESSGPPHFVELAHHQPADLTCQMKSRIRTAVCEVLSALGLSCGMAHLELKIIEDEIFFIEVGARGGGDHISDILTVHSTNYDYFKAAIECALGIYKPVESHSVAFSGIYFHCLQNSYLKALFQKAKYSDWCIANTVVRDDFQQAESNVETSDSGYFIYCSDHKITIEDA